MKELGTSLLLASALALAPTAQADDHFVFAHYMVCNPWNGETSIAAYKHQIVLAQRHGIDGFALNCGAWAKEPYYIERSKLIYEAAKQLDSGFKLFFSIDTCCKIDVPATALDMMQRFANHPNQFRHDGRPVLSAYSGPQPQWPTALAGLKAAGFDVCFVPFFWTANYTVAPSYDGVLNTFAAAPYLDGCFLFGIDAPAADLIHGNTNARRATAKLGKLYMAGASFAYNSANLRDFHGLRDYAAMWENLIRDGADWVEIVTWNDAGEDSHLMPAAPANGKLTNHDEAYLDITAYYAAWFKSGRPPAIPQEKIYYVYRHRPKWLRDGYDAAHKVWTQIDDQIHDDVADNLYVTALLQEPAELTIRTGNTRQTFPLAAGISHVELPFQPGVPQFRVRRGGTMLIDVSGSQEIVGAPTERDRLQADGYSRVNHTWSGGFCLGAAARYAASPAPGTNACYRFQVQDLQTGTYNVRIRYRNPTPQACRWTLAADGTDLQRHLFPVYLPPTDGKAPATVSFLWSLTAATTTLTLQRETDDWGDAQIADLELLPVAPTVAAARPPASLAPEMVSILAGAFTMGSRDGEPDEAPQHRVTLSAFQMGRYEVTNAEFEQFEPTHRQFRDEYSWRDTDPVIYVSWQQAARYCNWLSEKAGLPPAYDVKSWAVELRTGYRLPTEAEWEYVASGRGEGRRYPWGAANPDATRGNFFGTGTTPVGSFPAGASRDAVMDLAGNVFEWCTDTYLPYASAAQTDPCQTNPSPYRVIRGGSWGYYGKSQRATDREFNTQVYPGFYYGGFRVVLPATARKAPDENH